MNFWKSIAQGLAKTTVNELTAVDILVNSVTLPQPTFDEFARILLRMPYLLDIISSKPIIEGKPDEGPATPIF
ncbi:MAG: hypothetical protein P8J27_14385 [Mariniblastus sp.]|nr:hypothetical protein [Mariniblastus sp.]